MKNNLNNIKSENINKIDWKLLQNEMKNKFGSEIYDSWLKKIKKSKFKITKFKLLKRDSIINLYNCKFYFFFRIKINLLH